MQSKVGVIDEVALDGPFSTGLHLTSHMLGSGGNCCCSLLRSHWRLQAELVKLYKYLPRMFDDLAIQSTVLRRLQM
jgi:hypothetical protein